MSHLFEMPEVLRKALEAEESEVVHRRAYDADFGTVWLVESKDGSQARRTNWDGELFGGHAPDLTQWLCAFPPNAEPLCAVFIYAYDNDSQANLKLRNEFLIRTSEQNPGVLGDLLMGGSGGAKKGWRPVYRAHETLPVEVKPELRAAYRRLVEDYPGFLAGAEAAGIEAREYAASGTTQPFEDLGPPVFQIQSIDLRSGRLIAWGRFGHQDAGFSIKETGPVSSQYLDFEFF